jgi:hypothetical protein
MIDTAMRSVNAEKRLLEPDADARIVIVEARDCG